MAHKTSYTAKKSSRMYRALVRRTNKYIHVSIIDKSGHIHVMVSDLSTKITALTKTQSAKDLGVIVAKKALEKGINDLVFDRNGYVYHGRIAALCDGMREGGLHI